MRPRCIERDEGLRDTTLEALAGLKPVLDRIPAFHTAGTASQISDGAGALLLMTAERASTLNLEPKARVVDTCIVGSDPVLMLTGPIPATDHLLGRSGWAIEDLDVVEINEAFASVVLAWQRETGADMARGEPERWCDRARPPARCHGHDPRHQGSPRARAQRRTTRTRHDVLWRRPRDRNTLGADVTERQETYP